jgi:hypothetical protein
MTIKKEQLINIGAEKLAFWSEYKSAIQKQTAKEAKQLAKKDKNDK